MVLMLKLIEGQHVIIHIKTTTLIKAIITPIHTNMVLELIVRQIEFINPLERLIKAAIIQVEESSKLFYKIIPRYYSSVAYNPSGVLKNRYPSKAAINSIEHGRSFSFSTKNAVPICST
jgi:hypothetical protein